MLFNSPKTTTTVSRLNTPLSYRSFHIYQVDAMKELSPLMIAQPMKTLQSSAHLEDQHRLLIKQGDLPLQ